MSVPGQKGRPNTNWETKFLAAFADTGNATRAAQKAKVSRTQVYRKRLEDPDFAAAYEEARQIAVTALEAEAFDRALNGVPRYAMSEGQRYKVMQEYDNRLLTFLLAAHAPERYRETTNLHHSGSIDHEITVEDKRADILSKLAGIAARTDATGIPGEPDAG